MAKELVIKIGGDASGYAAALNEAAAETQELSDGLNGIGLSAGVAFAALTATIFSSVGALNVEAKALDAVTQSLQNQGIYTDQLARSYREVAESIEEKTGVDGDAISNAQAVAQGLVGQIALTDDLTRAVVDLSVRQGTDVVSAYTLVAKAVNGNVAGLQKMGVTIEEGLNKEERLARITEVLSQKFGGSAEAAANATGSTDLLTAAFGNAEKELGRRFAPAVDLVIGSLTGLINAANKNKGIFDFAAAVTAGGLAASAAALAVTASVKVYAAYRAAVAASAVSTVGMNVIFGASVPAVNAARLSMVGMITALRGASVATKTLVASTGIGLLVVLATEIYLNWSSIWPRTVAIFQGAVTAITGLAVGVGKILAGVFIPGPDSIRQIREGMDAVGKALREGYQTATQNLEQYGPEAPTLIQDPEKAKAAAAEAAKLAAVEAKEAARRAAENQLALMELANASNEAIDLKKQEIDTLKKLEDEKKGYMRDALNARLKDIQTRELEQVELDRERRAVLQDELLAENEAFQAMDEEQQKAFVDRNIQAIEQGILTRRTVQEAGAKQELELQKNTNNQFLLNQERFGAAYATINKAMQSAQYQGTKQAFGELAALQESSNATLKAIGKGAAIGNIVIKTAEAAMNIYAGFSTIPIVGPALGVAGAAAAVAFGGEQIAKVTAAAQGGLLTGGVPGKDSIPVMAMPGEVVVPTKNFEEVVGSVRAARESKRFTGNAEKTMRDESQTKMLGLLDSIDQKLSQPTQNVFQIGDVLADESYIERLARGLEDAILNRNLKIQGVNA